MTGKAYVLRGDARHLPLPDASVDLIMCSPPYFGLRSYTDGGQALAGQIGSEPTPQEFLAALWACTAEWARVLKPEGSLFVNLGDKYSGNETGGRLTAPGPGLVNPMGMQSQATRRTPYRSGVPPKSLLGLPWRYAIGCTDRLGLILRRDIIWHKPNGLPESVTDRCRSSHEYLFHFTKQPRYYAAVDEIREPHLDASWIGRAPTRNLKANGDRRDQGQRATTASPLGKLPGSVWQPSRETIRGIIGQLARGQISFAEAEDKLAALCAGEGVWAIPSAPLTVPAHLGVDHFAAFPPALVRPVVLGWSPPGVCTACGQGRRPVVDRDTQPTQRVHNGYTRGDAMGARGGMIPLPMRSLATITGYMCGCGSSPPTNAGLPPTRPAVVLDPFGGTGTTALVASVHGRTGISVDLSADYCRLAQWRAQDPGERARAMDVPKPPKQVDGQASLFGEMA